MQSCRAAEVEAMIGDGGDDADDYGRNSPRRVSLNILRSDSRNGAKLGIKCLV